MFASECNIKASAMKNSTFNLRGKSGRTYLFHTYKLPAKLTAVGGVFLYLKQQKQGDFRILKIGSTHSFEHEMAQRDKIKKMGATHITAMQKNGKTKRDQIAHDLRHLLGR